MSKKNNVEFFNPTVEEFIEKHKNMTLIGLAWALWWRMYVVVFIVAFVVSFLLEI